jgi:hypothetical protein
MKRLISIVLAAILVATCAPQVFAVQAEVSVLTTSGRRLVGNDGSTVTPLPATIASVTPGVTLPVSIAADMPVTIAATLPVSQSGANHPQFLATGIEATEFGSLATDTSTTISLATYTPPFKVELSSNVAWHYAVVGATVANMQEVSSVAAGAVKEFWCNDNPATFLDIVADDAGAVGTYSLSIFK